MAPKGNQNAIKLRDPEVRQEAYRQYCDHLSIVTIKSRKKTRFSQKACYAYRRKIPERANGTAIHGLSKENKTLNSNDMLNIS